MGEIFLMTGKRSVLDLVHSSINCDKSLGRRTVWRRNELAYTAHSSRLQSIIQGNQIRNHGRTEGKPGEDRCSPARSLNCTQLALLQNPGQPACGQHSPQWPGPPRSLSSQENAHRYAKRPIRWGSSFS